MKNIREIGRHFGIPVVDAHQGSITDIYAFLNYVKDLKNLEGFVVTFHNGHRAKMKAEEYLQLHKARDMMSFEKDIWAIILDEKIDDLLPLLEQEDQDRLAEFASKLNKAVLDKADELKWEVIAWVDNHGDGQKKFAVEFVNAKDSKFTSAEKGLLFKIKAGVDPVKTVRDYVRSQCSTSTTIDGVRPLVGGLKWDRYREIEE